MTFTTILIFLGACIGHAYFMTVTISVLYSLSVPHIILKYCRKTDFLIIAAGPILFGYALDLFGTGTLSWQPGTVRVWLAPYTVFCALLTFVVLPVTQSFYLLRRFAPQLVKNDSRVIDVAAALGAPPLGSGKHQRLALWRINQVFKVEFRTLTLNLDRLPPQWDGLTILHLTDLHFKGTPGRKFFQYVMQEAMKEGTPDIVAITGDVVDSPWHHRWVLPILGHLRWNIAGLAILGNHDKWYQHALVRRRLKRLGFHNLGNAWEQIEVRGQPMIVIGHEGPWFRPEPDLSNCPDGPFRLCLSHTPDHIRWARRNHIDLVLAGHVHGGQIRVPLVGSIFVPSRHSRRYDCGTFFEAPTVMHVSRGLSGQHPLRINCRPEVTRIVLKKA